MNRQNGYVHQEKETDPEKDKEERRQKKITRKRGERQREGDGDRDRGRAMIFLTPNNMPRSCKKHQDSLENRQTLVCKKLWNDDSLVNTGK